MSRTRKVLATAALAGLAISGAATAASAKADPFMNKASNWGPECVKVEYMDGTTTFTAVAGLTIIKAGQDYIQLAPGEKYEEHAAYQGKDISFVITCPGS